MKHVCNSKVNYHTFLITREHFMLRGAFNKFPDFFVQAFRIVVDS